MRWLPRGERQVEQMTRLVGDLLDVTRITQNRLELRRERTELAAVVESAIEISRPVIDASQHELTVTLPAEPICLDVDPSRLAQACANLLNNAAKFTEKSGRIWLTGAREGNAVLLRIKDPGIGIAAEKLASIFEMFSQVDTARGRSQGGLGIGLALVRRVFELHGGTIEARSDGFGKGSEFIVRLPVVSAGGARGQEGIALALGGVHR
jgi:signal transduction histidine kinase